MKTAEEWGIEAWQRCHNRGIPMRQAVTSVVREALKECDEAHEVHLKELRRALWDAKQEFNAEAQMRSGAALARGQMAVQLRELHGRHGASSFSKARTRPNRQ